MTDDYSARRDEAAEWWIVETKSAYFIYEDEATAKREAESQAKAYGYAEVHHAKSDYKRLERDLAERNAELDLFKRARDKRESEMGKMAGQILELTAELATLNEKLSRTWDTPGGKRVYAAMGEIERLTKERDELRARLREVYCVSAVEHDVRNEGLQARLEKAEQNEQFEFKRAVRLQNERDAARAQAEKLAACVSKYREYFGAIADGEYQATRPQPLRDYEEVMQLKANEALTEWEKNK